MARPYGETLRPGTIDGRYRLNSTLTWPPEEIPTQSDWITWRQAIIKILIKDDKIITELGGWNKNSRHIIPVSQWSPSMNRLYIHNDEMWMQKKLERIGVIC